MTIERAIKVLKDMVPKTCKMVNGRYVGGFEDTECPQFEAIQVVVNALEKQVPQKPKRVNKNSVFDGNWKMICPCCGAVLIERITTEDKSYPVHYNVTKHCMCGQVLDWSDTE